MQRYVATSCVFLVGALLATLPVRAQGISARNVGESLAGLNGVHVIVEDLSTVGTSAGLTAAAIKSDVEERLRARGVPVLGLGALAMDPRGPSLLIKVDLDFSEPVYFYSAQVQFFQNVNLMTGDDVLMSSASASTWQKSVFGRIGKFRISSLPQEILKIVNDFAADYVQHNGADTPESGESNDGDQPDADGETVDETAGPDSLLRSGL